MSRLADSRTEAEFSPTTEGVWQFRNVVLYLAAPNEQSSGVFSIALIDVSVWTNFLREHTIYRQTILAVPLRIWRPWRW